MAPKVPAEVAAKLGELFALMLPAFEKLSVGVSKIMAEEGLAIERAYKAYGPGTLFDDLLAVVSKTRPEKERLAAVRRVRDRLGRCVPSKRWYATSKALERVGEDLNEHKFALLFALTRDTLGDLLPFEVDREGLALLRKAVANELRREVLGPRHKQKHEPLSEGHEPAAPDHLLALLDSDEAEAKLRELASRCSPQQQNLITLLSQGHTVTQAATRLGVSPSTARVLLHQIRERA